LPLLLDGTVRKDYFRITSVKARQSYLP